MKTVIQQNEMDNDDRYQRIQEELQKERETSRKQLYEKTTHINELTIIISNNETLVKRLRREIEDLEAQLRNQQPAMHSSSLIFRPQATQEQHQLILPTGEKPKTQSRFLFYFKKHALQTLSRCINIHHVCIPK